ncbi:hypothetical protein J437_LFUL016008 [Ladona fulva]|uniref:Uncharacterized protein n=1 Tax=Ladona fulva TaxID=123851 RepID=A0A8K0KMB4_LADFU|nr:hypothetical protein J437_LFUL016008 [Ladona fulva]
MVENLTKENLSTHGKSYIPSKEELRAPLYEKYLRLHFSQKQSSFNRLITDDSFLHKCPTM